MFYIFVVYCYLCVCLGESYDYDWDFGGVVYLFLCGMNGELNSGVYFDKFSKVLIDGMDLLFS